MAVPLWRPHSSLITRVRPEECCRWGEGERGRALPAKRCQRKSDILAAAFAPWSGVCFSEAVCVCVCVCVCVLVCAHVCECLEECQWGEGERGRALRAKRCRRRRKRASVLAAAFASAGTGVLFLVCLVVYVCMPVCVSRGGGFVWGGGGDIDGMG